MNVRELLLSANALTIRRINTQFYINNIIYYLQKISEFSFSLKISLNSIVYAIRLKRKKKNTHCAIIDRIEIDALAVVGRYLPVHFVAVSVRRVNVIVCVHVFVDQDFRFLGRGPLGHGALFHGAPFAGADVVDGGEPEMIGPAGF